MGYHVDEMVELSKKLFADRKANKKPDFWLSEINLKESGTLENHGSGKPTIVKTHLSLPGIVISAGSDNNINFYDLNSALVKHTIEVGDHIMNFSLMNESTIFI